MSSKPPKRSVPKRKKRPASTKTTSIFDDLPELGHARALWQDKKRIEAAQLFEKIVNENPANIPALVDASRAFGALYQYSMADDFLRRAEEVGAASAQAMQLVGQSYRLNRRFDKAIDCFKKALAINSQMPDSHLELAILFERRNDLDAALKHCRARLDQLGKDGESEFLKGRILRRQGETESAQKTLFETSRNENIHWLTRARAFADLANLHDKAKQYKKAWEEMGAGKTLLAKQAGPFRQHREMLVPPMTQLAKDIRASEIQKWCNSGKKFGPMKPSPVLLTGMPRSGTTLLGQILDAHQQVTTADEFNLFASITFPLMLGGHRPDELTPKVLNWFEDKKIAHMRTQYAKMMSSAVPAAKESTFVIDKNPSLLPLLTPFVRAFATEKLIIMIRDPRDVLISCVMSYMPLNDFSVDFLNLESAVNRIESDLNVWLTMREKLPQQMWIEVKYESLVNDFKNEVSQILSFLDLEWSDDIENYRTNSRKSEVHSPTYVDVAKPIHTGATERWRNYEQLLNPQLERLNNLASKLGY